MIPAAMAAGATGAAASAPAWLTTALTAAQAAKGVHDLAGPEGALVTGDINKGMSAVSGISGGLGAMGVPGFGGDLAGPSVQSTLGMSMEQFNMLDPIAKQDLLRKVMGR